MSSLGLFGSAYGDAAAAFNAQQLQAAALAQREQEQAARQRILEERLLMDQQAQQQQMQSLQARADADAQQQQAQQLYGQVLGELAGVDPTGGQQPLALQDPALFQSLLGQVSGPQQNQLLDQVSQFQRARSDATDEHIRLGEKQQRVNDLNREIAGMEDGPLRDSLVVIRRQIEDDLSAAQAGMLERAMGESRAMQQPGGVGEVPPQRAMDAITAPIRQQQERFENVAVASWNAMTGGGLMGSGTSASNIDEVEAQWSDLARRFAAGDSSVQVPSSIYVDGVGQMNFQQFRQYRSRLEQAMVSANAQAAGVTPAQAPTREQGGGESGEAPRTFNENDRADMARQIPSLFVAAGVDLSATQIPRDVYEDVLAFTLLGEDPNAIVGWIQNWARTQQGDTE